MLSSRSILLWFLLASVSFCHATPETTPPDTLSNDTILSGIWEAEYLVIDPSEMLIPIAVKTAAYSQTVSRIHRGYRLTVTSNIQPIMLDETRHNWQINRWAEFPGLQPFLTQPQSRNAAVRSVLAWLETAVTYRDNPHQKQTIATAVADGFANCVGRADTVTTILKELGIQSRTITGCLYKNGQTIFHRWLEVEYPKIGSLPSEPGSTMDYVTPHHLLLLPSDKVPPTVNRLSALGVQIKKVRETRSCWPIDSQPNQSGVNHSIARRQTSNIRHHAALTGKITPAADETRIIVHNGIKYWTLTADLFGCFAITPIEPGHYQVSVQANGYRELSRTVDIAPREFVQLQFGLKK